VPATLIAERDDLLRKRDVIRDNGPGHGLNLS
jgi:hypothetical protein